ncbi:hypothetical protein PSECIP111951_03477 [Pseudoalteromonas holothuriae]|uniref:Uncharacterized protein n=1 Tax=Pseudoalteromonas holothuriae TaxID=2963714 RepID=A0A9W4R030_9GAMM|nr:MULTISPECIES: hypothetical protein [unclassified Pseudoalteromonas]CAH9060382.1 hypothetical protein PSECIP111854_02594 [Pseudoalteromonas sp. CIP111854]CAH9065980.1 hypothetical protein PSECIP111951_03477 [Pseudoalteromonas sp. CIP111951]
MQPLIIGTVLMIISFGLVVMSVIHGQKRLKFEKKLHKLVLGKDVDDDAPEQLQSQAYHIMMELGEALEEQEDHAQQQSVRQALSKVSELHAESVEYDATEGSDEEQQIAKAPNSTKTSKLKVVK